LNLSFNGVRCVCGEGYVSLDEEMANVTTVEGGTVRFRCDVTGFPVPRYRWLLNGQPLPAADDPRKPRFEVKTTVWGSLWVTRFSCTISTACSMFLCCFHTHAHIRSRIIPLLEKLSFIWRHKDTVIKHGNTA